MKSVRAVWVWLAAAARVESTNISGGITCSGSPV
jgi:hypothetical protein